MQVILNKNVPLNSPFTQYLSKLICVYDNRVQSFRKISDNGYM